MHNRLSNLDTQIISAVILNSDNPTFPWLSYDDLDEIVDLMLEMLCTQEDFVRIGTKQVYTVLAMTNVCFQLVFLMCQKIGKWQNRKFSFKIECSVKK